MSMWADGHYHFVNHNIVQFLDLGDHTPCEISTKCGICGVSASEEDVYSSWLTVR